MKAYVQSDEIAKGARVRLKRTGWVATIMDGYKKRYTRLALVEGDYTEYGSIYSSDIEAVEVMGVWTPVVTMEKHKPTPSAIACGYW